MHGLIIFPPAKASNNIAKSAQPTAANKQFICRENSYLLQH
jgi:hypothetical protein